MSSSFSCLDQTMYNMNILNLKNVYMKVQWLWPGDYGHIVLLWLSYVTGSAEDDTEDFYKEWWFILLMVLFFVILILLIIGFAFICYRRRKRK